MAPPHEQLLDFSQLSHAYVVAGSGAKALATQFVQALFCEDSCGTCGQCQKLSQRMHPDLRWVQSEGKNIKIDQVREFQQLALYPPLEARYKVFVLEDAHLLSREASNGLLKTLESPPPYVVFLLLTQHKGRLLPTVLSRCRLVQGGEAMLDAQQDALCWHAAHWLDEFELDDSDPEPIERTPKALAEALSLKNLRVLHRATSMVFESLSDWRVHHVLQFAATLNKADKPQQGYFLNGMAYLVHRSDAGLAPQTLESVQALCTSYGAIQANANVQLLIESTLIKLWTALTEHDV